MPTLSSSSMLASRSRKLCQSPSTSPAVHTVRARTEPKRPAPFTYLQIHAQVVHFVPFQGVLLPRTSLKFFTMVEWARLSCYGTPFASPLRSPGSIGQTTTFIYRCFSSVSYLGKNRSPCRPAHTSPIAVQHFGPELRSSVALPLRFRIEKVSRL